MTKGLLRFMRGNAIALLALFIALGGTTYAASTALIGKNTVASPQVVNGSLKTLDLSKKARAALRGARGARGPAGAAGPAGTAGPAGPAGTAGAKGATGAQGIQGVQGPAGTAVAYAHVNADGTVEAAASMNLADANVTHPATGVYCFTGLSFTVHSFVASPDAFGPVDGILVNPSTGTAGCASGVVRVRTTTAAAPTTLSDHPFYIFFE
jgi:hypothetical protein